MQTVHLRINDAATGQPTPVRLRVTDRDGCYFPPFGHSAFFPTQLHTAVGGDVQIGQDRWAYIDGTCEIELPTGPLVVEATKGPEYTPLRESMTLTPGKMALRFAIERHSDLRNDGWYSGDARCREPAPHAALLEAAAEDLAVVHLLARHHGRTYPNLLAYSGQRASLERPGHVVTVGTENRHPVLGGLALLHTHRVVYPLTFGTPDESDDWSLNDWCQQAHRKGGLVAWTEPWSLPEDQGQLSGSGYEALANAILGHVDALEITAYNTAKALDVWKLLANAGVRLPLVGASEKSSNLTPLGEVRTYARLADGQAFTPAGWIEAVRAGRTIVTTGPLLRLNSDGPDIHAAVTGHAAVDAVELACDGELVASGTANCRVPREALAGRWLAARAKVGDQIVAHTSAIVLDFARPADAKAVALLTEWLDAGKTWVETQGHFQKPKSREHLVGLFLQARWRLDELAAGTPAADT